MITYFVVFWTAVGQTPGMRLLRLRVVDGTGRPPRVLRSLLRLVGLALAMIPMLTGFLPALVTERRRALQDLIAGTVVVYDEEAPLAAETSAPADAQLPVEPSALRGGEPAGSVGGTVAAPRQAPEARVTHLASPRYGEPAPPTSRSDRSVAQRKVETMTEHPWINSAPSTTSSSSFPRERATSRARWPPSCSRWSTPGPSA